MKYIPLEKQSKKAQKAYYSKKRGAPIPPSRVNNGVRQYKDKKRLLKGVE